MVFSYCCKLTFEGHYACHKCNAKLGSNVLTQQSHSTPSWWLEALGIVEANTGPELKMAMSAAGYVRIYFFFFTLTVII